MTYFHIDPLTFHHISERYPEAGPRWDFQYGNRPEIVLEYFCIISYPELDIDYPDALSPILDTGEMFVPLDSTLFAVTKDMCYRWHNRIKIWVQSWARFEGDWSWASDDKIHPLGTDPILPIFTREWLKGWIKTRAESDRYGSYDK